MRFIEYMDVGGATRWSTADVMSRREMLERLAARYGTIEPIVEVSSAPADRFALPDGTVFGIISSTTDPFCGSCDRSRLTADGMWYLCLYASRGIDLREALRRGATTDELARSSLRTGGRRATDRGAEDRLALGERRAFVPITDLAEGSSPRDAHARGLTSRVLPVLFRVELSRCLETAKQQQRYRLEQALHAARLVEERLVLPQRHFFLEQLSRSRSGREPSASADSGEPTSQLVAGHLRHHHVGHQEVEPVELRRHLQRFQRRRRPSPSCSPHP